MKTRRMMLLAVLLGLLAARDGLAFYNPETGRWLNRDPIEEPGHRLVRSSNKKSLADEKPYVFVSNNPVRRIDARGLFGMIPPGVHLTPPNPGPCPCGEAWAQIRAVGPFDARTARRLANEALDAAIASGLPGLIDGPADAFRHCAWSCRMTQEIGESQAKEVGDVHELCNPNSADQEAMDQFNNSVGRSFGTAGADCKALCLQAAQDGILETSPGGTPPRHPARD